MILVSSLFSIILPLAWAGPLPARIAFLEVHDAHGRLVQYEPGSRFGHTALEVRGGWLQSYPGEGVRIISLRELQARGENIVFVRLKRSIHLKEYQSFLNRPFDFEYQWDDDAIYCSELIAKILGFEPEPMQFNRKVWPKNYWPLEGQPGFSPDKIYRSLTEQNP